MHTQTSPTSPLYANLGDLTQVFITRIVCAVGIYPAGAFELCFLGVADTYSVTIIENRSGTRFCVRCGQRLLWP
jgi:hypothetical protein